MNARNTRTSDPLTSYIGEVEHDLRTRTQQAADAVAEWPGRCRGELAGLTGWSEYELSKRLSDAERDRLAHKGEPVRFGKRLQATWLPGPQPTTWVQLELVGVSSPVGVEAHLWEGAPASTGGEIAEQ